jgi:hypothetical protein
LLKAAGAAGTTVDFSDLGGKPIEWDIVHNLFKKDEDSFNSTVEWLNKKSGAEETLQIIV